MRIGDSIRGIFGNELQSGLYRITRNDDNSESLRYSFLPSKQGNYQYGSEYQFYIFRYNPETGFVLLTDNTFGFLPISNRMFPRYLKAIDHISNIFLRNLRIKDIDLSQLSELKGMFGRCVKRDQHDWVAVLNLFGDPHLSILKEARYLCTQLRILIKDNDEIRGNTLLAELKAIISGMLVLAKETLSSQSGEIAPIPNEGIGFGLQIGQHHNPQPKKNLLHLSKTLESIDSLFINVIKAHSAKYFRSDLVNYDLVLKDEHVLVSLCETLSIATIQSILSSMLDHRLVNRIRVAHKFILIPSIPHEEYLLNLCTSLSVNVLYCTSNSIFSINDNILTELFGMSISKSPTLHIAG